MKNQHFNPRFLKFILLGVLVVGVGLVFSQWSSDTDKVDVKLVDIDIPHTFTTEATGLVNREISTSENSVFRLNKYDIKKGMASTFECNGLNLEENLTLTIGDMVMPLSAYDPDLKIGYIWLDYNLFGEGIIDKSHAQYTSQKEAEQEFLNQIEEGIELFLEDEEQFILDIFGEEPKEEVEEESDQDENALAEEVEVLPDFSKLNFKNEEEFFKINEDFFKRNKEFFKHVQNQRSQRHRVFLDIPVNKTRAKWDFFEEAYSDENMLYDFGQEIKAGISDLQIYQDRRDYLEIMFMEFKKMIFLNEKNLKGNKTIIDDWIFSASEIIDDPMRFFGFVERIKNIGIPRSSSPLANALNDEVLKIITTEDSKKWWSHSEALINLIRANKLTVIKSKREYPALLAEIIQNHPYQKWQDHYSKIEDLGNKFTISMKELEALPSLAATHGICIAPISILDDRTIYNMQEQAHQDKLVALRDKIYKAKNKTERKSFKKELMDLSTHRSQNYALIRSEAKAISMQKIIEDMDFFLEWAKDISAARKAKERV